MSDTPFRSLASETSNPLARQLLDSAGADASDRGARDRALLTLGLAPVGVLAVVLPLAASTSGAPVTAAAAGSSKGALLLLGKSLALGLAGSLLVIGVVDATRGKSVPVAVPAAVVVPASPAAPALGPASLVEPEPPMPLAAPPTDEPVAASPLRAPRVPAGAARETVSMPAASSDGSSQLTPVGSAVRDTTTTQLAALAAVRSALAAQQPQRALSLIDDFERRFPASRVAEEAAVLRIETLSALGRASEAGAMGRRFLHDRPTSVYGARVRTVTQSAAQGR